MKSYIAPYLFFNGNCREAFEYYKTIIGGELQLMTVGESPMATHMPDMKDAIIHAYLRNDLIVLMGSDMIDKKEAKQGNAVEICLVGESREQIKNIYDKLVADGGTVNMEFKEEFFGSFGAVVDKFGFYWMVQYSNEEGK
ncbi:MAG TPA: VOC family protein [Candidatus Woesebacteria bacterium]|nr:VOC family protein [Candidatus Woesebacteria bacterium]